jgi:hypothetical protein
MKKWGMAVSYRNKFTALKWKEKRDVWMLISLHDDEMGTIHDKKCGLKQRPKVCTDYNDAMGGVCIVDHSLWCTIQWQKGGRNIRSSDTS